MMECYSKGKNVEETFDRNNLPFKDLPHDFLWMQVKGGSKMTNLINHAAGSLEDKATKIVVWSGAGFAINKAISCAEILKRKYSIDHQITKLLYQKVEEYWEPKIDGLETLVVKRQIPVIHILLSVIPVQCTNELGYQTRNGKKFWQSISNQNNKKNNMYSKKKPPKRNKIEA